MNRDIYFRAFEYEDLVFINTLRNDDVFFELTCGNKYYTSSQYTKKWIDDKILNTNNQLYLVVCTIKDRQPIGYIGITKIDYLNRKAKLTAMVLDRKSIGKGYGFQANLLIIEHLFNELNMNMLYTYILTTHKTSLNIVMKLGFKNIGVIRDFVYKQNKFHDVYMVNIVKNDFNNVKNIF